jgi:hypothetical protein
MGSTNIKHDIPMYANLYLQGRFNLDDLISKEINISEINGAYQELKKGAIARSVILLLIDGLRPSFAIQNQERYHDCHQGRSAAHSRPAARAFLAEAILPWKSARIASAVLP